MLQPNHNPQIRSCSCPVRQTSKTRIKGERDIRSASIETSFLIKCATGIVLSMLILGSIRISNAVADNLPLYIFAGQSNAVGYGSSMVELGYYFPELLMTQTNVKFYRPTSIPNQLVWGPFQPPNEQNTAYGSGFGPEITTGKMLATALNTNVAMVKYAVSGTSIVSWNPNDSNSYYRKMVERVKQAKADLESLGHTVEYKGFFWMQGESDGTVAAWALAYQSNLTALINRLRIDLESPTLPVVLGKIAFTTEFACTIRQAQAIVDAVDPYTVLLTTDDLPRLTDLLHYNTVGIVALGNRYAQYYLQAFSQSSPSNPNLLINGNFELPSVQVYGQSISLGVSTPTWLTGWDIVQDGVTLATNWQFFDCANALTPNGMQWLSLVSYGAQPGIISQTFPTTAGATYELKFIYSALSDGSNRAVPFNYSIDGASTTKTINTAAAPLFFLMPWTTQTHTFMATGETTTLMFRSLDTSPLGGWYGPVIDDVSVKRIQ